ncbi:4Fe-4S binding protein [Candidatus Bipolaricaulota bacterium]|nr:4Fe-4S binding protein [Candidatus Bipolaricaulota bacterium]
MSAIREIRVGLATCGIAAGSQRVYDALAVSLESNSLDIPLRRVGCVGMCYNEPLVDVVMNDNEVITYGNVSEADAERIVTEHIRGEKIIEDLHVPTDDFLSRQVRIVLENCGLIDPESLDAYREQGGYTGLTSVLETMSRQDVIEMMTASGLRGRGGGGFPTGLKWSLAEREQGPEKYIICNADEGDPGAFMDRSVLEGDPHRVLEGMAIAGFAIGASHGIIYVRAEYPLAIERLERAIADARAAGLMGERILGSDFSLDIKIKAGAGAFVCGEETALIASIEGRRGMPRRRPPYPSESGLWGKPTCINNVETLANVPWIARHGAEAFAAYGMGKSRGTKVFALAGKIKHSGLIEVPMGMTIREIVFDIGGGILDDRPLKAVQMGGPSGGCIPAELADTPVDYEELKKTGAIVGSGGMIVLDESSCMVDIARFFLDFTQKESCGKCTFCRIGTKRMLETLSRICNGDGTLEDLDSLVELGEKIKVNSLCGLGQTAPNPVLTTARYFRDEYIAHLVDKACPAKVCKSLLRYEIEPERCKDCKLCVKGCPTHAISQGDGAYQVIEPETCVQCGRCYQVCPFGAITIETGMVKTA